MKLNNIFEGSNGTEVPSVKPEGKCIGVIIDRSIADHGAVFFYLEDFLITPQTAAIPQVQPMQMDMPDPIRRALDMAFQGEEIENLIKSGAHIAFDLLWDDENGTPTWFEAQGLPHFMEEESIFGTGPLEKVRIEFAQNAREYFDDIIKSKAPTEKAISELAHALAMLGGRLFGPLNVKVANFGSSTN